MKLRVQQKAAFNIMAIVQRSVIRSLNSQLLDYLSSPGLQQAACQHRSSETLASSEPMDHISSLIAMLSRVLIYMRIMQVTGCHTETLLPHTATVPVGRNNACGCIAPGSRSHAYLWRQLNYCRYMLRSPLDTTGWL